MASLSLEVQYLRICTQRTITCFIMTKFQYVLMTHRQNKTERSKYLYRLFVPICYQAVTRWTQEDSDGERNDQSQWDIYMTHHHCVQTPVGHKLKRRSDCNINSISACRGCNPRILMLEGISFFLYRCILCSLPQFLKKSSEIENNLRICLFKQGLVCP